MTKTAIMGFGNPVRSDDAVGIYVIEKLKELLGDRENLTIFDMGTSAFEVLFGLKGHQRIIMVDGVINTGGTCWNPVQSTRRRSPKSSAG